jgi:two-component system NtrC family sensor kinase
MKGRSLKTGTDTCRGGMRLRILLIMGFSAVIVFLGMLVFLLEATVISRTTVEQAQQKVRTDLNTARAVLQWKVDEVRNATRFAANRTFVVAALRHQADRTLAARMEQMRRDERLDILAVADTRGRVMVRARHLESGDSVRHDDPVVWRALRERTPVAGLVLESCAVLARELGEAARAYSPGDHDGSRGMDEAVVSSGMLVKAAAPVMDAAGRVLGVAYAAVVLNNDTELVDRIKATVFQGLRFRDRDIGTATVFLGDRRIATNVMLDNGKRAVGTRMSPDVCERVIGRGEPWIDRARVLNEWYITAYEPIRDPRGMVIGALYVGMREEPFVALRNTLLMQLGASVLLALAVAALAGVAVAAVITRPIERLMHAAARVAAGDFTGRVSCGAPLSAELVDLVSAFNTMSAELERMTSRLRDANQELSETNRTYMELLGIVSHEFKGALSSLIMNACAVRDGYLGPVSIRQRRALESMQATLDRLTEMARHYLDLSRLEKDELTMRPASLDLCSQVIVPSLEVYQKSPAGARLRWEASMPAACPVYGDRVLLSTVMDNLLNNAVKYGIGNGVVRVTCTRDTNQVTVRVFNTGVPIPQEHIPRLFMKFSRLHDANERRVRGTGLGLYIAAQIVARHGGSMRYEPAPDGNTFVFTLPVAGVPAVAADRDGGA